MSSTRGIAIYQEIHGDPKGGALQRHVLALLYLALGFFLNGACAKSDAAIFFMRFSVLGFFSARDAADAAALPVCFGLIGIAIPSRSDGPCLE